ncbi:MAG: hypothetical protein C0183_00670 [Roseiflexus castenholzii]|nr:MAG: hypothetical protein C0183_00670 [Roseiflexus castenholzii]
MMTEFNEQADASMMIDAGVRRQEWRSYPYLLVPDDPQLRFPQAEGYQDMASDTYYASGIVQGEQTGKRYAFFVIFARLSGFSSASGIDMHLGALFDLANGGYTTFASYDLPPKRWFRQRLTITRGHLGVAWNSPCWKSRFWARYDASGDLVPFGYTLDVCGRDSHGDPLALDLVVDAVKPPQPVGGPVHNGAITVMGQPNTRSYFQSLSYRGSLRWRGVEEAVRGDIGWLDRQWFPEYVGAYSGILADRYSHQWAQMSFDNGWELSLWRHFARHERNREIPFSGLTITDPEGRASFTDAYRVEPLSYCRDEGYVTPLYAPVQRLFGVRGDRRYFLDAYRFHVPSLDLIVTSTPLAPAPAHRMPVDYLTGPTRLEGTMAGKPVTGYGFNERTLGLWRPWELCQALADSLRPLVDEGKAPSTLVQAIDDMHLAIDTKRTNEARRILDRQVRPTLDTLPESQRQRLIRLGNDLAAML